MAAQFKKVTLRSLIAFGIGFGIIALATPAGTQMQKLPALDKLGLLIKIETNGK